MALLELQKINLIENNNSVIQDINLSINEGSITALIGEAGCGKSVLLKLMAGLILPSSGKVFFEGKNIHKMNREENLNFRKRCGFMFQDSALWANQDIYHNLELPLHTHFPKMSAAARKRKIQDAVNLVGYTKSLTNRPAALSIGEQKRIGFARAIICDPDVLFLDEPTESVSSEYVETIMNYLHTFTSQKKTVIFVSHDNYFLSSFFCDKIYLDKGTISKKEVLSEMLI